MKVGVSMLWSSNYEIGNAKVDSEHKEIFGMVERLLEDDFTGRPDKIKTVIGFLADYVTRHFQNEENLMKESGYAQISVHVKQHQDFALEVKRLVERIDADFDSIDLSLEVNKIIVDWLGEHVMGSDKAMIDHYRAWTAKK